MAKVRSLEDSNAEFKERLLFLEIVTKRHLDAKLGTLFSEGDEDGFILEVHKRVYIQMGENNDTVHSALDGVVSSSIMDRVASILQSVVRGVLHSTAAETVEKRRRLTVWENNVLMRLHFYLWRYRFSSENIIGGINGVVGFAVVKCSKQWTSLTPQKAKRTIGRNDVNPMQVALTMKTLRVRQPDWLASWLNPTPKRLPHCKPKRKKKRSRKKIRKRH